MSLHEQLNAEYEDALAETLEVKRELVSAYARIEDLESSATASGEPMPVGDLSGWRQIWREDFTRDAPLGSFASIYADTVGVYPSNYFDTSRNVGRPAATQGQYDAARVVSVSGSVLRKWLHSEYTGPSTPPRPKVAALLPKLPVTQIGNWQYQRYGRYAIRARVTAPMPGYKFAWLLWPSSDKRLIDGEIDWPEQNFSDLTKVSGFVHHAPAAAGVNPDHYGRSAACDLTKWHTFVIEWIPGRVTMFLDGVQVLTHTDRIPSSPMRWVIQTETEVSSTPPNPSVQGVVEIDWLAAWSYAP